MSANSRMRRAILVAFLLLAVSAASAIGSAAESKQTPRKTASRVHTSAHSSSHRTAKKSVRRTSRKTSHHTNRRTATTTKRASSAKVKSAAPPPEPVDVAPAASVAAETLPSPASTADVTAYAIGYRAGYKAGREAAMSDLDVRDGDTKSSSSSLPTGQPQAISPKDQNAQVPLNSARHADVAIAPKPMPVKEAVARNPDQDETDDGPADPDEATMATLELPSAATPISLRGSLASLERQNRILESEGLERILDERDLDSRISHGLLVALPASRNLTVNPNLSENHRYCRPWTARFLADLSKAHAAAFHRPFQVNSAVRTVEYQKRLMRVNGNAAAAQGDIVSPHLTGATIDIGKHGMTRAELTWMRRHLFALQNAGKIDVEEEFAQACFHITVYKTYTAPEPRKLQQPELREASAPRKEPTPTRRRGSSLPSSIAAGAFIPQGR